MLEILATAMWYIEAKNFALEQAIALRYPLSVDMQKAHRLSYSNYFINLVSLISLFKEEAYPHNQDFQSRFDNEFPFGKKRTSSCDYNYIKELRNSIVHRGLDITASAGSIENFPLVLAPQQVWDRKQSQSYKAFGLYILDIVAHCEEVVGDILHAHLEDANLLKPHLSHDESVAQVADFMAQTPGIPLWAKEMSMHAIAKLDHVAIQEEQLSLFIRMLKYNPLEEQELPDTVRALIALKHPSPTPAPPPCEPIAP